MITQVIRAIQVRVLSRKTSHSYCFIVYEKAFCIIDSESYLEEHLPTCGGRDIFQRTVHNVKVIF